MREAEALDLFRHLRAHGDNLDGNRACLKTLIHADETENLLSDAAPGLFGRVHHWQVGALYLGMVRITDRASSGKNGANANLTLERLVDACETLDRSTRPGCDDLIAGLRARAADLAERVEPIRPLRHKMIAHLDLSTSLSPAGLPGMTEEDIDDFFAGLMAFLSDTGRLFRCDPMNNAGFEAGAADAMQLVYSLRRARDGGGPSSTR